MLSEAFSTQLEWIKTLHQIRSPLTDGFLRFFDFFDRPEFIFMLIPTIWVGYHWKAGLRLFYILALSGLINYALKQFFEYPRPFHIDPSVGVLQINGYGFPSGAAQSAVLLSGMLLYYCKNTWSWAVAINFFFWLSLSRVHLGVHFPSDILGGWVIGAVLLMLFIYVRPIIEKYLERLNVLIIFFISQMLPLFFLCFSCALPVFRISVASIGIGLGVFLSSRYQLFLCHPKNLKELTLRAVLGVGGTFTVYAFTSLLSYKNANLRFFMQFFSIGLWLSLGPVLIWRSFIKEVKQ